MCVCVCVCVCVCHVGGGGHHIREEGLQGSTGCLLERRGGVPASGPPCSTVGGKRCECLRHVAACAWAQGHRVCVGVPQAALPHAPPGAGGGGGTPPSNVSAQDPLFQDRE